jgi:1,4-dihydroxy-6-naphthoate synthase
MSWSSRCGLPLPLGVNAIRRDLDDLHGPGSVRAVARDLRRIIGIALEHRDEALAYARRFAHGATAGQTERFVDMYVNRFTLDLGSVGQAAIRTFLAETHRAGVTPAAGAIDFVG